MKLKSLLLFITLCPAIAYCQSVTMPQVGYAEAHNTTVTKIEVTKTNTVVSFKHTFPNPGAWVEINKGIYLQDANGEEKYNYIKSEGIPLKPNKITATKDGQEVSFKVYFQKLKSGTKAINIVERAHYIFEQPGTNFYFNFYNVSLTKSAPAVNERVKVTDVVLMAPPRGAKNEIKQDTAFNVSSNFTAPMPKGIMDGVGPMMGSMYSSILDAQLKVYSKPETTAKLAQVTKNYYDALIKVGFSEEAALKIITSKSLISMDGK
ncbi:MAG: hypothetical protein ABIN91_07205 [Mucilaginibacter sp.]|uniref:hypothetical protein n=1 Tax=Mucilaginibacter sp. TaxID=1882438 RepID=UPI003263B656